MYWPIEFAAGIVWSIAVPSLRVYAEAVAGSNIQDADCVAPLSTLIKMVKLFGVISIGSKCWHQEYVVFSCYRDFLE